MREANFFTIFVGIPNPDVDLVLLVGRALRPIVDPDDGRVWTKVFPPELQ